MDSASEIKQIISSGRVATKREFYLLFNLGLLGNKPLCWNSHKEILKSNWQGRVCLRPTGVNARGNTKYDVPIKSIQKELNALKKIGIPEHMITYNQSLPNDCLIIQGEITRNHFGVCLHYTTVKKPMALGLKEEQKNAQGLLARIILQTVMSPQSFAEVETLLDMFPDSVIEFGSYSVNVGNLPGRNTIIWEVRNY